MLLVCDYEIIFKDDIEVINEFVKKGNIFIITTHLSVFKVQKKLKDLNFSYIICNNGSMVFDKDFNLIYRQDLKKEVLKPIFAFLKKSIYMGNPVIDVGYGYCRKEEYGNVLQARIVNLEKAQIMKDELLQKYPLINIYIDNTIFSVTNNKISKINALKWLSKKIKVKPRHMYFISNNVNDFKLGKKGKSFTLNNPSTILQKKFKVINNVAELIKKL